jgi:hypothetical protein
MSIIIATNAPRLEITETMEALDAALPVASYERDPLPWEPASSLAKCNLSCRRRGGRRPTPLPDFYIGAHAAIERLALLTRDFARYRNSQSWKSSVPRNASIIAVNQQGFFLAPSLNRQPSLWRGRSLACTQSSWDNEPKGTVMQITLELPEDIARGLESEWKDLPRAALESLALEAYRSRTLTAAQLRRLLGFATRMQVDAFLKEHEVYDFTVADFEQDRETLRQLRAREAQH